MREFWREVEVELGQQYMTGSWGGLRNRLSNAGLTATMTYTTDLLGNPIGGTHHGFRYTGDFGIDLTCDLEKGLGWKRYPHQYPVISILPDRDVGFAGQGLAPRTAV